LLDVSCTGGLRVVESGWPKRLGRRGNTLVDNRGVKTWPDVTGGDR
jgi:hypothetical protein